MKISIHTPTGAAIPALLPYETAPHVTIAKCPACEQVGAEVRGTGVRHHDHDTYYAERSVAMCCGAELGQMRAKVDTVFGIEEDIAVLNGRCRVY